MSDFAYDRAGRLVTLTAYTDGTTGAQDTIYAYNGRGLQTIVTYEETGDVTMAYDACGNMTKRTDEEGVGVDYAYDTASRLTQRNKDNRDRYRFRGLADVYIPVAVAETAGTVACGAIDTD